MSENGKTWTKRGEKRREKGGRQEEERGNCGDEKNGGLFLKLGLRENGRGRGRRE